MPFKVQPTTVADIPRLVDIYHAAFANNPFARAILPDTPAVRQWLTATLSRELQHQRGVAMYNLVEYAAGTDTPVFANTDGSDCVHHPEGKKNIIALAKWLRPMEGVDPAEAARVPGEEEEEQPLPAGCDAELFQLYFPELIRRHRTCMGTRAHWYLELLATHPSHQRRGAASALVNHVLANPANAGCDAYLEASPDALSTYARLGFETRDGFVMDVKGEPYETLMMVRPGNKTTAVAAEEGGAVAAAAAQE